MAIDERLALLGGENQMIMQGEKGGTHDSPQWFDRWHPCGMRAAIISTTGGALRDLAPVVSLRSTTG
ncbi:MAG TPA: hypothetical protein VFE46_17840 [Pirellulales bacterium]|nr:hypothetical protein [Pirellulales bacterium]